MKRRKPTPPPRVAWKTHASWLLGTSLVLGITLTVKYFNSDSPATAETGQAVSRQVSQTTPPASEAEAGVTAAPIAPSAPPRPQVDITSLSTMAMVNGEEISREQLQQQCLIRYGEEMLESIVSKHIILQACQENNVVITNGEIEQEIARIAGRFDLGVEQWMTLLQNERGISGHEYRSEIVWPMLALRRLAAASIVISPEEYAAAYEREYGPRVVVRVIVSSNPQQIQQLHAQATAEPGSFGDLAKEYSQEPTSASQRGLIPAIRRNVGEKAVEDAAFALQPGEISPILETGGQYVIMQCERHYPATQVPAELAERAERELREKLTEDKMRSASAELFAQLEERANVREVLGNEELMQQMPGVAAVVNGQQVSLAELAKECLERHGATVLEGEIHRVLLIQALRREGLAVTEESLNSEISRAAESYGYINPDGSADITAWLEHVVAEDNATVELYVRDAVWPTAALKKLVGDSVQVTQDDLEKGFLANYGEMVRVQAIVSTSNRQAAEVWERARQCNTEEYFGELAVQYSMEPISQSNAGHVPPIRQFGGQPRLEEEAFRLKEGEISGVVNVGEQFIILRSLGRTEPIVQSLDVVRTELTHDIHEKKMRLAMANTFEALLTGAQIDNFVAQTSQSPRRGEQAGGLQRADVVPASASAPIVAPASR